MSEGFLLWTMWLMLLAALGYALYSAVAPAEDIPESIQESRAE